MAPKDAKKAAKTPEEFRRYQRERIRRIALHSLGYLAIILAGTTTILLLAGDYSNRLLSRIGLRGVSNPMTRAYADCSKPENRGKGYCIKPPSRGEQQWQKIKRRGSTSGATFELN